MYFQNVTTELPGQRDLTIGMFKYNLKESDKMVEKTRSVLIPEYTQVFQCIGSAYEDTCCADCRMTIDKSTFQKQRKTRHPDLGDVLKKNVKRNRTSTLDAVYRSINMDSSGNCTMLDEDRLWKKVQHYHVQKQLDQHC